MAITVSKSYPPNYEEICKTFDIRGKKHVVFTYGETIYVPSGIPVDPALMAHEEIHVRQQTQMGPEVWWEQYLADPEFRLSQELESYRMQWAIIKLHYGRSDRRGMLRKISKDLAGPIYGNIMSTKAAEKLITEGL